MIAPGPIFEPARRWIGLPALLLACTLALSSCGGSLGQAQIPTPTPLPPQPAVEKQTYTVARGSIVEQLELSGRVSAVKQDDLYFSQAGNVGTVYVKATDAVTKGRVLAELSQNDLVTQLKQSELGLEQAKLSQQRAKDSNKWAIELAQLDLNEANLKLSQAGSNAERQLAQIGVQRAQIGLEQAQASTNEDLEKQVAQAQLDYDRIKAQVDAGRLYAPYDGVVESVTAQPGAQVEAYVPVLTIMDPKQRELRVDNAVSTDLDKLSVKQPVDIRFSRYPDTPIKGVVERLPQTTTSQTAVRTDTAVHISYEPGTLDLDFGDLARIVVTLQHKDNILWLPTQAVRTFQGRRFVVVQDGNKQRRADVKLGITGSDRVEIVDGLKEGQVVVGQ